MIWKPPMKSWVISMWKWSKPSKLRKPSKAHADRTQSVGRDQKNAMRTGVNHREHARIDLDTPKRASDGDRNKALSGAGAAVRLPSFLRRGSGYKPKTKSRAPSSSIFSKFIAAKNFVLLQGVNLNSAKKAIAPTVANRGAQTLIVAIALLALFGIVAASFLLSQVASFKSENRLLQQEVSKLRENLGRLEQMVRTEKDLHQKNPEKSAELENRAAQQSVIELSKDEIEYIREYIKPAPGAALAGSVINVGELFEGATIPLPAPLIEKIPKLGGARFAIRNGAIVILKRGSHRVNAVLFPN
jgi:hypothetical protein